MQKLKSITTWFHFKFSLALKGIFLSSDWPSWLLWFWFYNTQSKTFYVTSVVVITLCGENHVIPSKILLFPPPPLPAPLMRNNDWSSTVTLSFSLHNVSREMFLQAATSCARASSPCPRLVILNRVNRLTDWRTLASQNSGSSSSSTSSGVSSGSDTSSVPKNFLFSLPQSQFDGLPIGYRSPRLRKSRGGVSRRSLLERPRFPQTLPSQESFQ